MREVWKIHVGRKTLADLCFIPTKAIYLLISKSELTLYLAPNGREISPLLRASDLTGVEICLPANLRREEIGKTEFV